MLVDMPLFGNHFERHVRPHHISDEELEEWFERWGITKDSYFGTRIIAEVGQHNLADVTARKLEESQSSDDEAYRKARMAEVHTNYELEGTAIWVKGVRELTRDHAIAFQ